MSFSAFSLPVLLAIFTVAGLIVLACGIRMSKEKAARIANAQANQSQHPSKKGGKADAYEEWTRDELYERAQEIGIEGRSDMSKDDLITALRNH